MVTILSRLFIRNRDDIKNPSVHRAYGVLCGICGVLLNLILFAFKFYAGIISNSIAVTADAFNNLSDSASSLITIVGFKLSGQKPDSNHPFGHGRFEYITGLIISVAIIIMGFELMMSSIKKIFNPEKLESSPIVIVILILSIGIKLYMAFYNRSIGKKINSVAIKTAAQDSISDCASTAVVLISIVVSSLISFNIECWCGLAVSLFILYSGFRTLSDTINPLLGQPPSRELIDKISSIIGEYDDIVGMHDLVVHDYGPGRMMLSLHAEVSCHDDFVRLHDIVDNAEHRLAAELDCSAVIHMDPVDDDDELTNSLRDRMCEILKSIDEGITVHDFRIVSGPTHINLIFDVVIPYKLKLSDSEVRKKINHLVKGLDGEYFAVVNVDREYV